MGFNEDGYWSPREIDSYSDCQYRAVLSDRGRGKSYGMKEKLMGEYERKGKEFMCLYRTAPDMKSAKSTWLDTLYEQGYEPGQFHWEGDKDEGFQLYYREDPENEEDYRRVGFFRALAQVNRVKQEKFPEELATVWFDEFIPLKYTKIPGVDSEGDALRTIVKTIEHDSVHPERRKFGRVVVYMFANPFTWNNPLLSYFKIVPKGYGCFRVGPGIVCEMLEPIEHRTEPGRKQTVEDFLGDDVVRNQGYADQMAFVEPVAKGAEPFMSMRFKERYYLIYVANGLWYVTAQRAHRDIKGRTVFGGDMLVTRYGTVEGLQEKELCFSAVPNRVKDLRQRIYGGRLRFDTLNTKFDFYRDVSDL